MCHNRLMVVTFGLAFNLHCWDLTSFLIWKRATLTGFWQTKRILEHKTYIKPYTRCWQEPVHKKITLGSERWRRFACLCPRPKVCSAVIRIRIVFQVFLLYFIYLGCYFISRSLLELEKLFQSSEKHVWHHPKVKSVTWAGKHGPVLET